MKKLKLHLNLINFIHNNKINKLLNFPSLIKIIIITLFLIQQAQLVYIDSSITLTNYQISATASYNFTFQRAINPVTSFFNSPIVPAQIGSTIQIVFPNDYSPVAATSTLPCTNPINSQTLTCNVNTASNSIIVQGYYATSATLNDSNVMIKIDNIINPFKAKKTANFLYYIKYPNSTILDQSPALTSGIQNGITFNPGAFTSCSISAKGETVSTRVPFLFTIYPKHSIPSSGQVIIQVPLNWNGDVQLNSSVVSTSCSNIANLTGSISCSFTPQSGLNIARITVSSLSTSTLDSTQSFSFQVNSILTPPFQGSTEKIKIYSQWSDGTIIDQCTSQVSNVQPIAFQSISFASLNNNTVQSTFNGQLKVSLSKAFYYQDQIQITVPTDFLSAVLSSTNFATFSSSRSGNLITMNNFPNIPAVNPTNTLISINLANIKNPVSTNPLTIIISLYRYNYLYMTSSTTYSAIQGTPSSFILNPTSSLVKVSGSTNIQIQTNNLYAQIGSYIQITYPASISASNLANTAVTKASLGGVIASSVTYSVSNNLLKVENLFTNSNFSGLIEIDFPTFINPPTIKPTTYSIILFTSDNFKIFSGSTSFTANLASFKTNSIITSSYTVLAASSTITANFQSNYPSTQISIIVPSQIRVGSSYQTTCNTASQSFTSCTLTNGNNMTFYGSFTSGNHSISWGDNTMPSSKAPTNTFLIYTYSQGWGVQISTGLLTLTMSISSGLLSSLIVPSSTKNSQTISMTITFTLPLGSPSGKIAITVPSSIGLSSASCTGCSIVPPVINLDFDNTTSLTKNIIVNSVLNAASFKSTGSFNISLKNLNNFDSVYQDVIGWTNTLLSTFTSFVSTANAYRGQSALFTFTITNLSGRQTYVRIKFPQLFPPLTTAPSGTTLFGDHQVQYNIAGQGATTIGLTLITPTEVQNFTFSLKTTDSEGYQIGQSVTNTWTHTCSQTVGSGNCRSCQMESGSLVCVDCYNSIISVFNIFNTTTKTCDRYCSQGNFLAIDGVTCSPCDSNCYQCLGSAKNCTDCNTGTTSLYLDPIFFTCVYPCQTQYYNNSLNGKCMICKSPCQTCKSDVYCLTCKQNFFLQGSECLSSCSINTRIQNTINRTCDLCNSTCKTCIDYTYQCTSCYQTGNIQYLQNNRCVNACSANSFPVNNVCTPCQSPCDICTTNINTCQSCLSNVTQYLWFQNKCLSQTQCKNQPKYYVNSTNGSCNACPSQCELCTSLVACSSCSSTYFLLNGKTCILNCSSSTNNLTYGQNQICKDCSTVGCLTCSSATECTSCQNSQYLYLGDCLTQCPTGTYINGKICSVCPINCTACINPSQCQTCIDGQYVYQGTCYQNCPTFSTYTDIPSKSCINCPTSCKTCTSPTQCLTCQIGYNLENQNTCVQQCSVGTPLNQVCQPCGLNCQLCQDAVNIGCQQCQPNYVLHQKLCLSQCPVTYVANDGKRCELCSSILTNCSTCIKNSTTSLIQCTSCIDGQLINAACQPCQPGTYSHNSRCPACPSQCAICQNQTFCSSCSDNFYIQQNFCVATCPLNKIPNGTICTICVQNCANCNLNTSLCSICSANYFVHNGGCVTFCPMPLVQNLNNTMCVTRQVYVKQYSQSSKIIPFPFTIASIAIIILGVIFRCVHHQTRLPTLLVSFLAWMELGVWILFGYIQYITYINLHYQSMIGIACVAASVAILIILNIIHIPIHKRYVSSDVQFQKWQLYHFCINGVFMIIATIFNFKIYRILHSKWLQRQEFSFTLQSTKKLIPISVLSGLSILFCSVPAIVGSSLALYFSQSIDQQWYVALDCLIVTSLVILVLLIDMYHPSEYFVSQIQSKNLKNKIYQDQQEYTVNCGSDQDQNSYKAFKDDQDKNGSRGDLLKANETGFDSTKYGNTKLKEKQDQFDGQFQIDQGDQGLMAISSKKRTIYKREKNQKNEESQKDNNEDNIFVAQRKIQSRQTKNRNNNLISIDKNENKQQASEQNKKKQNKSDDDDQLQLQSRLDEKSNQDQQQLTKKILMKWVPKNFDHHGYQIKYDQNGDPLKYDENGYLVKIDQEGNHKKYNQNGNEIRIDNKTGQHLQINKQGHIIKDGVQYDYQTRYRIQKDQQENLKYFDQHGYQVIGLGTEDVQKIDQNGNKVIIDQNGQHHHYNQQGFQVFQNELTGKIIYINKDGKQMRKMKNSKGQQNWQAYDQNDGLRLIKDQDTGEYVKYDKHGFRVEKDQYGNILRYDKDDYRVKLGWNDEVHRYDQQGYQIKKDEDGNIHRYDEDGFQVIKKDNGQIQLYDQNGYRVQKDFYGQPTFYDNQGNTIVKDPITKKHRKFNPEGLQIIQSDGKITLKDKRGNIVVEKQDGFYQKYDQNGNKIWLDGDGYQIQTDKNGNITKYDKAGDRVKTQQDQILDQDQFVGKQQDDIQENDNKKVNPFKKKKNRFAIHKDYDFQGQYSKMINQNQDILMFNQQDEQDDHLREFHDAQPIETKDLQEELRIIKQKEIDKMSQIDDHMKLQQLEDVENTPYKAIKQRKQHNQQYKNMKSGQQQRDQMIPNDSLQKSYDIKSMKDAEIDLQSHQNDGVTPLSGSEQDSDQLQAIGQINPMRKKKKKKRDNMSQVSYKQGHQNQTKTEYNYNTVDVKIKNNIIDFDEEQSLGQDNWQQNQSPFMMAQHKQISNANTGQNIIYMEDDDQNKDTLSDFINSGPKKPIQNTGRYSKQKQTYDQDFISNKNMRSIQQQQDELFDQLKKKEWQPRKDFKLSGQPNPLVQYAKQMQNKRKSLNEKMYFDNFKR